ncbi:crinkler (CRN) family protein, partial [Thraustotheca clavata]
WTDGHCGTPIDITPIQKFFPYVGDCFYIRKEVLCVLQNFKNIYQKQLRSDEAVQTKFVLLGTPGTGKSCLLALICMGQEVLMHHNLGDAKGLTHLLTAVDPVMVNCWPCLDGVVYNCEHNLLPDFKLLTASGQYDLINSDSKLQKCLLPYWQQTDLEYFGLNYLSMEQSEINAQLYESGGSLRLVVSLRCT